MKHFESTFSELLVEHILYLRDRNPKKIWGHIWGWNTIFSYTRIFEPQRELEVPESFKKNQFFHFSKIVFVPSSFSQKELYFISKYNLFDEQKIFLWEIDVADAQIFPYISMILNWYHSPFQASFLNKYPLQDSLYYFLLWISDTEANEHNYYFLFSEKIQKESLQSLLESYKLNPNYLFTNIALASVYFHQHQYHLAYKFYLHSLKLDPNNPYVLAKLAQLLISFWEQEGLKKAEEIMKKVITLLSDVPWPYHWYAEILNRSWKYSQALENLAVYDRLTEGKHRTFEPYLVKAEAYLWMCDLKKAQQELEKRDLYYFWNWYEFVYNELMKKIKTLESRLR